MEKDYAELEVMMRSENVPLVDIHKEVESRSTRKKPVPAIVFRIVRTSKSEVGIMEFSPAVMEIMSWKADTHINVQANTLGTKYIFATSKKGFVLKVTSKGKGSIRMPLPAGTFWVGGKQESKIHIFIGGKLGVEFLLPTSKHTVRPDIIIPAESV